jgi:hypothetical protein
VSSSCLLTQGTAAAAHLLRQLRRSDLVRAPALVVAVKIVQEAHEEEDYEEAYARAL